MTKTVNKTPPVLPDLSRSMNAIMQAWGPLGEYMTDAMQRTILYWDVLRQRSDQYYAQKAKAVPHVLNFDAELVLDARTFKRPVNYMLVCVKPPEGVTIAKQTGVNNYFGYDGSGFLASIGGSANATWKITASGTDRIRCLIIERSGRARVHDPRPATTCPTS